MWRNKVQQRRFKKTKCVKALADCHKEPTYDNYVKLFKHLGIKKPKRFIKLDCEMV